MDLDTGRGGGGGAAPGRRGRYDNASQDPGGGRGNLEAVDVAPSAEDPAECVTDKGYHSRLVLKALDDGPWKSRISEPKQKGFARWHGDDAARRAVTNNRTRLLSGVAREAFKLRAEIVERSFAHNLDRGGMRRPRPLVVMEHRAHRCRCGRCGRQTRAAFPAGVTGPVRYGARIGAMVVYLSHYQLLPEDRLAELMADLFAVALVPATVARMGRSRARRFEGVVEVIRDLVKSAPVKHMDETGLRVGGRTQWLHVASSAGLTFYRVSAGRGSLLDGVAGIVVHDHWKPYFTMQGVDHALCNAHHLRELQALIEIEKEGWARKMQRLLRRACHAANLARERGVALQPSLVEGFRRWWDAITAEGIRFHEAQPPLGPAPAEGQAKRRGRKPRRTGHNLLLRLQARKEDALRFLANLAVPFTNNQAEQDVRMAKLKQKISGGFRSEQGANDFATIRGFISTAKKQGWNIIPKLMENPETLIARLRDA